MDLISTPTRRRRAAPWGWAVAVLCGLAVAGCSEPAVGIPIEEGAPTADGAASPQATPTTPTTEAKPIEDGGVRVTQTDIPTAKGLGAPTPQAELAGAWLPLSSLNPKDREALVAVFNRVPAPCGPCEGESMARCLVSLPPRCENLPLLAERALRMVNQRTTFPEIEKALAYGDLWVPVPTLDRPKESFGTGAVPIHVWMDPAAPSIIAVVATLDTLELRDTSLVFHFLPDTSSGVSLAAARAAAAARQQGLLEGFLRGIITVRTQAGIDGQRAPLTEDQLSVVAVGLTDQGLDLDAWEEQRASGVVRGIVDEDLAVGAQLGVRAAPTWFIDGYRLRGAQSVHALQGVLDRARTDRKAAPTP